MPAWLAEEIEGGVQLPMEESNLSKEGPEDKEESDSQAPEGLLFLKQYRKFLLYSPVLAST